MKRISKTKKKNSPSVSDDSVSNATPIKGVGVVGTAAAGNPYLREDADGNIWIDLDDGGTKAVHPAAAVFGLLPEDDLDELVADIEQHGLRKPVELWRRTGQVLDGVNRLIGCRIARVKPTFIEVDTDDPIAYVISANQRRRHMTASRRAVIADELAQLATGRHSQQGAQNCAPVVTQQKAADMMNVSRRSVQDARTVRTQAEPEVRAAVRRGAVSVDVGAAVAKLPAAQQKAAAAEGKAGLKKAAKRRRASVKTQRPASSRKRQQSVEQIVTDLGHARSKLYEDARLLEALAERLSVVNVGEATAAAITALHAEYEALELTLRDVVGRQVLGLAARVYIDASTQKAPEVTTLHDDDKGGADEESP